MRSHKVSCRISGERVLCVGGALMLAHIWWDLLFLLSDHHNMEAHRISIHDMPSWIYIDSHHNNPVLCIQDSDSDHRCPTCPVVT
jgi:hypothetical protein